MLFKILFLVLLSRQNVVFAEEADLTDLDLRSFSAQVDPNFDCPLPFGRFPRADDCRSFHHCHEGRARILLCPPLTVYDVRMRACFVSAYATCFEDEPFNCPSANGAYRHDKCDRYFLCRKGKSYLRHCPYWTSYDTSVKRCVAYFNARCEERTTTTAANSTKAPIRALGGGSSGAGMATSTTATMNGQTSEVNLESETTPSSLAENQPETA